MGVRRTAVLLLQMGGPENLGAIRPFLFNLFSDPEIVPLPGPLPVRWALARLISSLRSRKVSDRYAAIGGGSPVVRITREQAEALERRLAAQGLEVPVRAVMRYSHPRAPEALEELKGKGINRLVALSLYPHYSRSTTGSSLAEVRQLALGEGIELAVIDRWGDEPAFLDLLSRWIIDELDILRREAGTDLAVVFSAHGLPQRLIEEGDPYLDETRRTVEGVVRNLGGAPWRLSFQSRVGPVKWLEPATGDVISDLGRQGVGGVLLVPISFVSDHIETLYDMDIVYRNLARKAGIVCYRRLKAFNADPAFIDLLFRLAAKELLIGPQKS